MMNQWYDIRKSGVIICRQDLEVPTDAHDSRGGGGGPDCSSCSYITVAENYKGNTQNSHTYSTKIDPDSLQTEPPNAFFLFWQCFK